ncbi:unnamed protein product [Brassica napus]|uniref:(rape) hypothetical protein n=1 Tax=Brassica napus TaxID=3708 RepID=A0A816LCF5_BRANA|nr:unnamed protein product [Brassica napus]
MPQSEVLNHPLSGLHSITESSVKPRRNTNQASKRLKPNLNTSGLTGHTSQCDTSIRQSNLSSKRTCSDIQATNLFKAFSTLEKTDNVNGMEFGAINLNLFEDQGSQIYDISSEEEDTNYDNNSESETECAPQQDQNVTTVPDEQRARIKTMASVFQSMFQDKPAKKGWSVSKRTETRQDSDRKPLLMQLDQERHIPPRLRPRPIGGSKTNHKPYRIKRKPEKPPLSESLQPNVIGQVQDLGDLETIGCNGGKQRQKLEFTLVDICRVLADVTNTRQTSPTMPQSEVLNHPLSGLHSITESSVKPRRNTNQASKRLKPNLNTSGLTGHTSQCDTSIRQSNLSSKRTCSDIQATNLFKAFSTLEKTDNVNGMEFGAINLNLFEDQGSQIYDISSEEEDTNYDNNSESETECAPQQDQNVTTVPDEQKSG